MIAPVSASVPMKKSKLLCLIAACFLSVPIATRSAETSHGYEDANNPPMVLMAMSAVPQNLLQDEGDWLNPISQFLTGSSLIIGNQFTTTPSGDDLTFTESPALDGGQFIEFEEKCLALPNCGIGSDIALAKTGSKVHVPVPAALLLFLVGLSALGWLGRSRGLRNQRKRKRHAFPKPV